MDEKISRRRFFIAGNAAVQGTLALLVGVPVVGYVLGAIFSPQPTAWVKIGSIAIYPAKSANRVLYQRADCGRRRKHDPPGRRLCREIWQSTVRLF